MPDRDDTTPGTISSEEDLLAHYFRKLTLGAPSARDLRDDAAELSACTPSPIVVTKDMLVAGVHFLADDRPQDIAYKAVGVNVSDLVAKGARPFAYLMGLAVPRPIDADWLDGFVSGFSQAEAAWGGALIGGDTVTTPGPVTISITALGHAGAAGMIPRDGAAPGDRVCLTGTVGDASLGLALRTDPALGGRWQLGQAEHDALLAAYLRPAPPLAFVDILRGHATAALDISDGLGIDFARLCRASGVGGAIRAPDVPVSATAGRIVARGRVTLAHLLSGGDDYQVLFTIRDGYADVVDAARTRGIEVHEIGVMDEPGAGVRILDASGDPITPAHAGYDHFSCDGEP